MIPLSDENAALRLRRPVVTLALLGVIWFTWLFVQRAGVDAFALAASICHYGLVPGELTGRAAAGAAVPIGPGMECILDPAHASVLTPLTSMFLHGGWAHIIGNAWFLWLFGNNVEDSMGRFRYLVFYLVCGIVAAAAQVLVDPASPVPMVGASGAISGVLGAYLVLYPRVRVRVLVTLPFIWNVMTVPAYAMLGWWIVLQVIAGLPRLASVNPDVSTGVAVFAHIGGFFAGAVLVKVFASRRRIEQRNAIRHSLHPTHP